MSFAQINEPDLGRPARKEIVRENFVVDGKTFVTCPACFNFFKWKDKEILVCGLCLQGNEDSRIRRRMANIEMVRRQRQINKFKAQL